MGWIGQISSVVLTAHKEGAQKHGNHCGTSCLGPRWETPIFWRLGHRQVRSHYIQTTRNFWRILPDLFSSTQSVKHRTRKLLLHLGLVRLSARLRYRTCHADPIGKSVSALC